MPHKSVDLAPPASKPVEKCGLLEAPPSDATAENPSIGGRLPTASVWRSLEEDSGASSDSTVLQAGRSRSAPAAPTTKLLVLDGGTLEMKVLCDSLKSHGYSSI